MAMTSNLSLSFWFHHQNIVCVYFLPHISRKHSHYIPLNFINWTVFGEQYKSWSSTLCSFLQSPVTCSFLGPNIFPRLILKHFQSVFFPQCDRPSPKLGVLPTVWLVQSQNKCGSQSVTGSVTNQMWFPKCDWPIPKPSVVPTMWQAQYQTERSSHNVTVPLPNHHKTATKLLLWSNTLYGI